MRDYLRQRYRGASAPKHIWCSMSIEDQDALVRLRHLQQAPVALRVVSFEPLLGPSEWWNFPASHG